MKAESEKLKSRTSISMDDGDWSRTQRAAKVAKTPLSQYLRDAVRAANAAALVAKKNGEA